MKHTLPKSAAPADHSAFGRTMLGFEHTLYANLHQYPFVPFMLFLVGVCAILASFNMKDSPITRMGCYLVAFLVVTLCIFII
jgi:hypothetical protein